MVRIQKSAEAIVAECQGECPGHGEGLNIKERNMLPRHLTRTVNLNGGVVYKRIMEEQFSNDQLLERIVSTEKSKKGQRKIKRVCFLSDPFYSIKKCIERS